MGFIDKYPYTDFHELNLDWVLKKIRELGIEMDQFEAVNKITFSGAWNITSQYPAWTVVTDNNLGYISIQPVPVGITITNTDYWRLIVDYSAQLAGMQSDIDALELIVGDNSSGLVKDVNDLQADMAEIRKKKYIFGGDSYSIENYGHTGWMDLVAGYMNLTRGVNVFDARDLVGYYGGSFAAGTFLTQLQALDANMSADLKEQITDICYFAGTNEVSYTDAQIYSGISDFVVYARAHFPNALVTIGFIGGSQSTSNWSDFVRACNVYRNVGQLGCRYVNNIEYVNMDYDLFYDTLHPTSYGKLAKYIAEGILAGSVNVNEKREIQSSDTLTKITIEQSNKVISIRTKIASTAQVNIGSGWEKGTTELADLSMPVMPYIRYDKTYTVPLAWYDGTNWHSDSMIFTITADGKVMASAAIYPETSIPAGRNTSLSSLINATCQLDW